MHFAKLKTIAFIYGNRVTRTNGTYFKYYRMNIYKLSDIEKFFAAIKEGIITAQLAVSLYKNGYRKGKPRDRNLLFQIKRKNIPKIFDEIYTYEDNK